MKYPQLVSTRAVNAISDWLVSRLEQLGVEAPQPYTRLLLSLLQSTIQLNDPIELSNLESFLASRKGGNRRYQHCDTDALKKFNAVQCLKEIVSSEQEIAAIENLVDELCEKLKDIEKQTGDSDDEHKLFVATLNLAQQTQHHSTHISAHHHHHQSHRTHHNQTLKEIPTHSSKNCNISRGGGGGGAGSEGGRQTSLNQTAAAGGTTTNKSAITTVEREDERVLDPLDLYRRAFPALSKEMENSFLAYRRNVKWLTWPPGEQHSHRRRDHTISISSSSSTISSNSAAEGDGNAKDVGVTRSQKESITKDKKMLVDSTLENASKIPRQEFEFGISANSTAIASATSDVAGGIKRKTKRRRSQGLSKGARKNLTSVTASGTSATSIQNTTGSGRNKRNSSPTYWDTDFEGCWEMGRDLIKEFITRQNRNSRNRSTSESAVAYKKKHSTEMEITDKNTEIDKEKTVAKNISDCTNFEVDYDESNKSFKDLTATPAMPVVVDFSFCDYDEYDDTLASVSELTNDEPLLKLCANKNDATNRPKRLYERELLTTNTDMKSDDEQSDVARFEAKFNSSVEALWKDAGCGDDEKTAGYKTIGGDDENKMHVFGFGNDSSNTNFTGGPTSLPCDMPFRQNLKNFWTNYYNHRFDLNKMLPASLNVLGTQQNLNTMMQQCKPIVNAGASAAYNKSTVVDATNKMSDFLKSQTDISATAPTSDYYSMPSTLDNINKVNMQRCGIRHNSGCSESGGNSGTIGEERKTPVALFLHSTIWSENANVDGGDTDESFFFKVHNSGNRLNASKNDNNSCGENEIMKNVSNNGSGGNFGFTTSYTGSKWSEGINAGPTATSQQQQQQNCGDQKNNSNLNISFNSMSSGGFTDCTDSSTCSTMTNAGGTSTAGTTNTNWRLIQSGGANMQQILNLHDTWTGAATGATSTNNKATKHMRDTKAAPIQKQQYTTAARYNERDASHTNMLTTPKVTLVNHSPSTSGFIAYSRIKSVLQLQLPHEEKTTAATNVVTISKQQQLQRNYATRVKAEQRQQQPFALDMLEDGENLLTSERTHFHPIKSYVDGHTFDICSELDIIEYQRSASGYLHYEQDKYLEYTRNDNFMVEDDGNRGASANSIGASANPLYANSNCEAATAKYKHNNNNNNNRKFKRTYERDFVIKFRLQRTDIACQTDVIPPTTTSARAPIGVNHKRVFGLNMPPSNNQTHPLSLIFSNAAKNLKANAANQLVYSDTVEAFTRAMAHFPPPPTTASNSIWLPVSSSADMTMGCGESQTNATKASHIWNIYQHQQHSKGQHDKNVKKCNNRRAEDGGGYDEVDFYGNSSADLDVDICQRSTASCMVDTDVDMTSLEQEWSMNEIRRKCKEAGHIANYGNNANVNAGDNNKSTGNTSVAGGAAKDGDCAAASVWGMCAACNSELKSIPANRLLRDELQVEADEIMSDLKYMQDLYIGRASDGDDADDEDDGCVADDESGADTVTSDSDWCADDITADVADEINMNISAPQAAAPTISQQQVDGITVAATNESDTLTVIQKVNRLIAELLRPENNNEVDFNMYKLQAENAVGNSEETQHPATAADASAATVAPPPPPFSSNLWHTSNTERNIWQLNAIDSDNGIQFGTDVSRGKIAGGGSGSGGDIISDITSIHPMQLLRQFNVNPIETMTANVSNIFSLPNSATANADNYEATEISWEHENLARIWQTSPTTQSQPQQIKSQGHKVHEMHQKQSQQPDSQAKRHEENMLSADITADLSTVISLDAAANQQIVTQEESEVAEKNMRNLRANADASVEAAAANFQKAQQFLARQQSQNKAVVDGLTSAQLLDSALKMKASTRKRRHSASQNLFHTQLTDDGACVAAADFNAAVKSFIAPASNAVFQNNNNNKISDLNSYALESDGAAVTTTTNNANALSLHNLLNASLHFGAAAAAAVAASNAKKCSNYATGHLCGGTDIAYGGDATAAAAKNQTIITCKYHLTTIEPMTAMHKNNDDDDDGNGNDDNGIDNDVGLFDGITTTAPLSCILNKNSSILNHVTMTSRPLTR